MVATGPIGERGYAAIGLKKHMLESVTSVPGSTAGPDRQSGPEVGVELLEQRAALLALAESVAGIGHWLIDLRKGELIWSDEVYRIHGVSSGEYSPEIESAIDFYHPDDAARVSTLVDSAISDRRGFEFECRLIRPDGTQRVVHSRAQIQTDAADDVVAVLGVLRDVTDERNTQASLEQQVERFNLASLGASVGLWDWDVPADEFRLSERGARLTDMPLHGTRDTLLDSVVAPDRSGVSDALTAHIERRVPFDVECRVRLGNREIKWIRMCGQARWDDRGRALQMAGSLQDISEQKRHGALRDTIDGLANISGSDSHERIEKTLDLSRRFLGLDLAFVVTTDERGVFVSHACDAGHKIHTDARLVADPVAVARAALRQDFLTDRDEILSCLLASDVAGPPSAADMIALGLCTPADQHALLVFAAHATTGRVFGQSARSIIKLAATAIRNELL